MTPQSWAPSIGHSQGCVSVSNTDKQDTERDSKPHTTYSPAEIYEIVQEQIRMVEVETAVGVLKKHGWYWEQFDPGRSGLVPGFKKLHS